ncbi:MAG: hypothetical protein AB1505_18945 [Candidatus Latescibacterota bacterium]
MSSYEHYDFRAVDRPLSAAQREAVASLSSRAEVSARHAAFTYHYSSFRGDPEQLLATMFDAMLYVANWGLELIFSMPVASFDTGRAAPYLVAGLDSDRQGVWAKTIGDRVLLGIGLHELDLGWVEGEGWLEPMLPLREALLQGDDRPLYLFWLGAFANGAFGLGDPERAGQRMPSVPAGMNELGEEHRIFARRFGVRDGLLAAASQGSRPRQRAGDEQLVAVVESLAEAARRQLLVRVGRGEHLEVHRELARKAPERIGEANVSSPSGQTLAELAEAAERWEVERQRQAEATRLDELEAEQENLWTQVEAYLAREHPRYREPVGILAQLHELAKARGNPGAFAARLEKLEGFGRSPSFMKQLRDRGIVNG